MRFRIVIRQLGLLVLVMSGAILAVAAWSWAHWIAGEASERNAFAALITTVATGGLLGLGMWMGTRRVTESPGRREAILLVAVSWFLAAGLAAMPFRLWAALDPAGGMSSGFDQFANGLFESSSGLTTTGATILSNVEALPRSLLLWRATTHWIGGCGIIVLFVAVFPILGMGGKRLFRAEASAQSPEGVSPRIQETARVLWLIYMALTAAEIVSLMLAGMSSFDAVCHAFATISTGGFSTRNASVAYYDSVTIEIIIMVFMVASGASFGLYHHMLNGRWRLIWKDPELRFYLALMGIGILLVSWSLVGRTIHTNSGKLVDGTVPQALRYGAFHVITAQTCTGFCVSDYNGWSFLAKLVILSLMLVGGCTGSTSGGLKVIRLLTTLKIVWAEIERVFRPQAVRPVKVGTHSVDAEERLFTLVFAVTVLGLVFFSTVLLILMEGEANIDITTAASATIAAFSNVGPGLGQVGSIHTYGWFTGASKYWLSVVMILGRLEVFTFLVLVFPRFWRSD